MERRLPLLMLSGVLALFVSLLAAPGVTSALPTASGALGPGSRQSGTPEPAPPADAHLKRQVMGREVVVAVTNGRQDGFALLTRTFGT